MKAVPRLPWDDKYKKNWDESYRRVMAWWNNEDVDRPVIFNAVAKPEGALTEEQRAMRLIAARSPEEAERFETDAGVQLNNARYANERSLFVAESAPHVMSNFGSLLGLLCVQAGGRLDYSAQGVTSWLVREEGLLDRDPPETTLPCYQLDFLLDIIGKYHAEFGQSVVLGANPMIDPLTTLSMMCGVEDLCVAMLERPEAVQRWVDRLSDFFMVAVEGYRAARAKVGRREDYNWTGAWAPGDMDAVQCDFSVMLSPEMFRAFALPVAERETAFFDYAIWHLDGTGEFKHLDDILALPNLDVIQYVDEMGRDPVEFADVWRKILKRGKSIVFNCHKDFAYGLTKALGPRGLAFTLGGVEGESELDAIISRLARI